MLKPAGVVSFAATWRTVYCFCFLPSTVAFMLGDEGSARISSMRETFSLLTACTMEGMLWCEERIMPMALSNIMERLDWDRETSIFFF